MKAAFVIWRYPPVVGGTQRQARYLAHLISERLGACDVVTSRVERHLPARDRDGNVSVRRLPTGLRGDFRHMVNAIMAFFYFLVH